MRILLTGASGFIGSAVLDELLQRPEIQVWALVHEAPVRSTSKQLHLVYGGLEALNRNVLSTVAPDVIIHLARPTFPRLRWLGRPLAAWKGARLNRRLLRLLESEFQNMRLIYVSGSLMYGQSEPGRPHTEESILNAISYARDYAPIERPLMQRMAKGNTNILMLRVPWVLGDGSWFKWIYVHHRERYRRVPLFGTGDNQMSFILRQDLARYVVEAASRPSLSGVRNVFSNATWSQRKFAENIAQAWGCDLDNNPVSYERAIQEAFRSNIELATLYKEEPPVESDFTTALNALLSRFAKDK